MNTEPSNHSQANGKIRAVLVDFGGVLYRLPNPEKMIKILHFFGRKGPGPFTMQDSPLKSKIVWDLMTGQVLEHEVWQDIAKHWRMNPRVMQFFRNAGYAQKRIDRDLIQFLDQLRPEYRTAVLTNAGTDFRSTFCKNYALDRYFDHVIISAEEKVCKPVVDFYHLAAQRLGVEPSEVVFVDDMEENIEGAKQAGFNAFLYQSGPDTMMRIKEFLEQKTSPA